MTTKPRCKSCLGPLQRNALYGFCHRNPTCRRKANAIARRLLYWRLMGERPTCELCGAALRRDNRIGVCTRAGRCWAEYTRRWRHADPRRLARAAAAARQRYHRHRGQLSLPPEAA